MKKFISSIFMITGTTIGGGMVMLPAVVGIYGYYSAMGILIAVWFLNLMIALSFLEANYYLPPKTSLISMTKRLLGKPASWIAWVVFLGFLYTIMCVYITGITEIISGFLEKNTFPIPSFYWSIAAVVTISMPIYLEMKYVSFFNKLLVIGMFTLFLILMTLMSSRTETHHLLSMHSRLPLMALPIVFTSFGFLVVIPSLRSYLHNDSKKLKNAIIIGSLIPLMIYLLWTHTVMGMIPTHGLQLILHSPSPIQNMANTLIMNVGNPSLSLIIQLFILFAITSSFVGISLGLYDFLADGLHIEKTPAGKLQLLALTFLPPLLITLSQTHLFLVALGFAGLISTILFGLYPIVLAYSGRYIHKLSAHYRAPANRLVFLILVIFCLSIIGIEIVTLQLHFLH